MADAPPKLCVIHSANDNGAAALKSPLPAALLRPLASFTIEGDEIFWNTVSLLAPCSVSVSRARPWTRVDARPDGRDGKDDYAFVTGESMSVSVFARFVPMKSYCSRVNSTYC
jgi:hypothetical protein